MRQIRAARNVENLKSEACMDIIFPILTPLDFSLNSNSNLTGSWVSYTFILSNTMQGNVYETPYTFNFLVWGIEEWPYMPRRKVHLSRILHMSKTKQKGDALWRKEGKDVTAILWSSPPTSWNLCLKNSLSPRLYLYKSKYKYHLFLHIVLLWSGSSSVMDLSSLPISPLPTSSTALWDTQHLMKGWYLPKEDPPSFQ